MNCEGFQKNLLEYVDDTLSPGEKAEAEAHLGECSTCRELVQHEWLMGQVLSGRLREAVETVTLDAHAQRRMAAAVLKQIEIAPEPKKRFSLPSWFRFALPAAALVLISAIWLGGDFTHPGSLPQKLVSSPNPSGPDVPVHVSWSEPRYTFHRDGTMVVDALISDTRVADGVLLATKINPIKPVYEH